MTITDQDRKLLAVMKIDAGDIERFEAPKSAWFLDDAAAERIMADMFPVDGHAALVAESESLDEGAITLDDYVRACMEKFALMDQLRAADDAFSALSKRYDSLRIGLFFSCMVSAIAIFLLLAAWVGRA